MMNDDEKEKKKKIIMKIIFKDPRKPATSQQGKRIEQLLGCCALGL